MGNTGSGRSRRRSKPASPMQAAACCTCRMIRHVEWAPPKTATFWASRWLCATGSLEILDRLSLLCICPPFFYFIIVLFTESSTEAMEGIYQIAIFHWAHSVFSVFWGWEGIRRSWYRSWNTRRLGACTVPLVYGKYPRI
ncbi:hypothetical protein B0I35DRAFT_43580 [Stachybotrys elegans]|uniref:Uncharacterized protein n=1 Tax=Stachybotrys elegans TaxID=80388 RepID=A0A8K0T378_9HYPO|nr:hypothetical protein B0I35DRAFT_43580 [Stachybotrys elegans]